MPLIVLQAEDHRPPPSAADSVITKPISAAMLLVKTRELLDRARRARVHADTVISRGHQLMDKSARLVGKANALDEHRSSNARPCPECGRTFEWVERGTIGGVTYDYYRWCLKGCGLYCYDRDRTKWVKLA